MALAAGRSLLHLDDVNTVPAALDALAVALARLLDEDDAGEAGVIVPEVHRGHAALEVHLAVLLER